MSAFPEPFSFVALDACHQQMQMHLAELAALVRQMETSGLDATVQRQAGAIEAFFSGTARQHHAEEEKNVFPALLMSGNAELVAAVYALHQDHGWIEENWLELGPQLRAIAMGNNWFNSDEFKHAAEVFLTLCQEHIAQEESLVYPEAKALLAQAVPSRNKRAPG
ncbi:hemerythrin domain-containing protein [Rhodoferax sp.]|uniref:hemerythrin domain-containing protein n=1 Tax=Rhodoferax sp. TaxID=50421 RepID=UPI00374D3F76